MRVGFNQPQRDDVPCRSRYRKPTPVGLRPVRPGLRGPWSKQSSDGPKIGNAPPSATPSRRVSLEGSSSFGSQRLSGAFGGQLGCSVSQAIFEKRLESMLSTMQEQLDKLSCVPPQLDYILRVCVKLTDEKLPSLAPNSDNNADTQSEGSEASSTSSCCAVDDLGPQLPGAATDQSTIPKLLDVAESWKGAGFGVAPSSSLQRKTMGEFKKLAISSSVPPLITPLGSCTPLDVTSSCEPLAEPGYLPSVAKMNDVFSTPQADGSKMSRRISTTSKISVRSHMSITSKLSKISRLTRLSKISDTKSTMSTGEESYYPTEMSHALSSNLSLAAEHTSRMTRGASLQMDIRDAKAPWAIFVPESPLLLVWGMLVAIAALLFGLVIPPCLAYSDASMLTQGLLGTYISIAETICTINIPVTLSTAIMDQGTLVVDRGAIAGRYARSWLLIDLATALPLGLSASFGVLTVPFCVLKLLRVCLLGRALSTLQRAAQVHKVPIKTLVMFFLASHVLSCCWRVARRADDSTEFPGGQGESWWVLYILDLYWVQMTMTTVGYGDINPNGTVSRLCAILAMMATPVVFGTVVSVLGHATKGVFDDEVESQISVASRLMRGRGVPRDLRRRVEHNLRVILKQDNQMANVTSILGLLSPALQRDLSLEFLSNVVLEFPLFSAAPHAFIAELAQGFEWVICLPGDVVMEEGQLIKELVFVIYGRLIMQESQSLEAEIQDGTGSPDQSETSVDDNKKLVPSDSMLPEFTDPTTGLPAGEIELAAGAWMGEISVFDQSRIRDFGIYAIRESELAALQAMHYLTVLQNFPKQHARHQALEKDFQEGKLNMSQLRWAPNKQPGNLTQPLSPWQSLRKIDIWSIFS